MLAVVSSSDKIGRPQRLQLILRARQGEYQGEVRTEITCVGAKPVSHAEHGRKLLAEVREMLAA